MTEREWAAIEEIFHVASDMPAADRSRYLDAACRGDDTLRREVEGLLEAVEEDDSALRQAVGREANAVIAASHADRRIGAYQIVERLGQGGMGTVYAAVRADDQYEKRVAIKLLRAGAGQRRHLVRRFLNERQILANLEHPNIARLLDGGVTEDGLPYLVMEYVDGLPIDEYARTRNLDVEARLRLFLGVCDAVRHAHRNMVIHRDLKPSNVLVDGGGTVKLLDFGIAKIATADAAASNTTVLGERMLTPDYASPEMIRGEAITTLADVYSLGVILYELLALARPFRVSTVSLFEMERAIMTAEPERPSAVSGSLLGTIDRERRQDLDAIVGKAMRKEAQARYPSVEALAEDIQRYLGAFPVEAREGTRRYKIAKFVRRHKLGVAAAAVFVVTITGFATGMAVFAARAAEERDVARRERTRAEMVSKFLGSLFAGADPRQARGETVTARDLLDRGAERIGADLDGEPGVQSQLLATIGQAYQHLGLLASSEAIFEKQLELERRTTGERSRETLHVLRQLSDIQRMRGKNAEARRNLRVALASQHALLGRDAMDVAHTSNNLGLVEQSLGNIAEAVNLFREAVRVASRYPAEETEWLTMRSNLGSALADEGNLAGAESELREVLARRTQKLGADHPQRIRSMGRLARVLFRNGAYREAAELLRQAIPLSARVWGETHPDTLLVRSMQAELDWQLQRQDDAAERIALIVRQGSRTLGPDHPSVLSWRVEEAAFRRRPEERHREACNQAIDLLGRDSRALLLASALERCGELNLRMGRAEDALRMAERGLEIRNAIRQSQHPDAARLLNLAGRANLVLGRREEGGTQLEKAVEIDKRSLQRPHLQTADHLTDWGAYLERQGSGGSGRALVAEAQVLRQAIARETGIALGKVRP